MLSTIWEEKQFFLQPFLVVIRMDPITKHLLIRETQNKFISMCSTEENTEK
jgi:hypothetical protein